jgi:hypothetical protein
VLTRPHLHHAAAAKLRARDESGHGVGFEDRLDDIGRQVGKPQNPADMGVVELELSGDLRRVAVFSAAKITNP